MSKLTAQILFDQIVTRIVKQGAPSTSGGQCMYRGPGGRKCAVGIVLHDSEYEDGMEGHTLEEIALPARLEPFRKLLHEMQWVHDDADGDDFVSKFTAEAARVARKRRLTMPKL